jgi:hypothetical protein
MHSRPRSRPPIRTVLSAALVLVAGLLATQASLAATSTTLSVTGLVASPKAYDLAGLQALPQVTQVDTFAAGNVSQTHTYVGASLWNVVNASSVRVGSNKNDILDDYVLATGADGYQVVYSMGEIAPGFGNEAALVATSEITGGAPAPLGSDGFARTTAPGDVKGGRYVSNLVDLDVRASGSTVAGTGGGASTQFSVTGAVTSNLSFDLARLQGLPAITEVVNGMTYVGASLWDLLTTTVGVPQDASVKNDILGKYVVATGSDGYKALFSMGEIDPAFGDLPDIVAYSANGQLLDTDGFARIVVPDDVKAGRFVSNLVNLQVFSASPIPEPATAILLLAALALLAACKRRLR